MNADSSFGNLMSANVGHLMFRGDFRSTWFPDEGVTGQPSNLGYWQEDLNLSAPVWQDSCNDLALTTHIRGEFFSTDAILPTTKQPFPDELWDIRLGTTYRHLFDNGWVAGGSVSFGSASDQPFHGIGEMTAGVNAFLRVPSGEHNAWLFSLSYSVNSELAFPIPMVAYLWQPSDNFRMNIGLPFAVMWRPIEDLTLDASYMLLRTIHARATYRLAPPLRLYAAYDWSNESYFLVDRPADNDRFFYYDMRLTAGVQWDLARCVALDVSAGYVFDRFYFEGAQYSDNGFNRVDVGAGPFGSVRFLVRW